MREEYTAPELIEWPALTDVTGATFFSDRNLKANVTPVEGRDVLARLARLPVSTWNYRAENPALRHIGPVAEDFRATFEVGGDSQRIHPVDANGVALAAIQGLYQVVQEKDSQVAAQRRQIEALEARLAALEAIERN